MLLVSKAEPKRARDLVVGDVLYVDGERLTLTHVLVQDTVDVAWEPRSPETAEWGGNTDVFGSDETVWVVGGETEVDDAAPDAIPSFDAAEAEQLLEALRRLVASGDAPAPAVSALRRLEAYHAAQAATAAVEAVLEPYRGDCHVSRGSDPGERAWNVLFPRTSNAGEIVLSLLVYPGSYRILERRDGAREAVERSSAFLGALERAGFRRFC